MLPANQAVEALISEYYKLVFHTIYGLTGNWEESQDLTQDTFQQALKGIDSARAATGEQFHAKAWLLRIALNTVRMQNRRRALFRFIPFSSFQEKKAQESNADAENQENGLELLYAQATPLQPVGYGTHASDDPAELISEQDMVRRTLAKIPEQLRMCLLLSIVAGLSTTQIADVLELKEDAVRQRLSRARQQFRQLYEYESKDYLIPASPVSPHDNSQTHQAGKGRTGKQSTASTPNRLTLAVHPPTTWSSYV
jgi:RNA polymerase sigma-70 factor (ECF subfamily)